MPASLGGIMFQYTPRYPKAFGHPAWKLYGSVNDVLQQDLLWRKVQTDPALVASFAKLLDPEVRQEGEDIFLSDNTAISLHPESCGAYSTPRNRLLNRLHGNSEDKKFITEAEGYSALGGFYLGPLFRQKKGWLPENVYSNIIREIGLLLAQEDRYLFNRKACHNSVLMTDRDKQHAQQAIKDFPIDFGFKKFRVYWYSTENGSTAFGVVHFFDESGMIAKLPISAWQYAGNSAYNIVFDLLHPANKIPLYNLNDIVRLRPNSQYVLICSSETMCETIKQGYALISQLLPITTYSSIEISDWASLGSLIPLIFPDNTAAGCCQAFEVFLALKTHGLSPYFFKRHKINNISSFTQDISAITRQDGECSLPEFAEHCRREFGVEPPRGILPQGQPLLELPGSENEPEMLLEGLLCLGDQVTIFAWRGVGKSLFALLLALCFANGYKALGGKVCPSRKYRVLIIDAELPADSLKNRARSIAEGLGLPESAANELIVRSFVIENKDIRLDTEAGWEDLLLDLEQADIIIVDSLFKVFPTSMSTGISNAAAPNMFYDWCRKNGKTAIVVDHQGKKGDTAYGTMGKEIALDVVLQLKSGKCGIEVIATKNRNFESGEHCWTNYTIKNEASGMVFDVCQRSLIHSDSGLPCPDSEKSEDVDGDMPVASVPTIDQAIVDYVKENPTHGQKEVCAAVVDMGICKRAAAYNHYRALRENGMFADPMENNPSVQLDDDTC